MSEPAQPAKRALQYPDDIVRDIRDLPSAPAVLPQLLTILNDPAASMGDVIALIKIEPGIAVRVLQLGNSVYYSKGGRCTSLDEGVNRIGFLKIYEVVAYAVSSQLLMRKLSSYKMEADDLWRRAVGCAIAASNLAAISEFDTDVAYTIGLFHAVGLVAIDAWLKTNEITAHLESKGLPHEATEAEKHVIGFSNASIASALLKAWSFKTNICESVRWQYSPLSGGGSWRGACLLHVAKWIQAVALAPENAPRPPLPDTAVLKEVGLKPADIDERVKEVREEFTRASMMLVEA
jgi:HD-like signal output (HDOD) protein